MCAGHGQLLVLVKAKFHYAIQVADLVSDLSQIARICLQPAFDPDKVASWSQTRMNLSKARSELTRSATTSATWIA